MMESKLPQETKQLQIKQIKIKIKIKTKIKSNLLLCDFWMLPSSNFKIFRSKNLEYQNFLQNNNISVYKNFPANKNNEFRLICSCFVT